MQKIEDKHIQKIDEIVSEVQLYYSKKLNYEKCIHKIKEFLPIFLIFYFRSGVLLYEYSFFLRNESWVG